MVGFSLLSTGPDATRGCDIAASVERSRSLTDAMDGSPRRREVCLPSNALPRQVRLVLLWLPPVLQEVFDLLWCDRVRSSVRPFGAALLKACRYSSTLAATAGRGHHKLLSADQPSARDAPCQLQCLALEQPAIDPTAAPNEAGMGAFLGDMSVFEDQQSIERAHGR